VHAANPHQSALLQCQRPMAKLVMLHGHESLSLVFVLNSWAWKSVPMAEQGRVVIYED
jgi:hypothetical protein